jgi:hypothetical protein
MLGRKGKGNWINTRRTRQYRISSPTDDNATKPTDVYSSLLHMKNSRNGGRTGSPH